MTATFAPHGLLAALRRLPDGCMYCGEPATQLARGAACWGFHAPICSVHTHDPDDDPPARFDIIPLAEILDDLGVQL